MNIGYSLKEWQRAYGFQKKVSNVKPFKALHSREPPKSCGSGLKPPVHDTTNFHFKDNALMPKKVNKLFFTMD